MYEQDEKERLIFEYKNNKNIYEENKEFFDEYFYYIDKYIKIETTNNFIGKPHQFLNLKETLKNKKRCLDWIKLAKLKNEQTHH